MLRRKLRNRLRSWPQNGGVNGILSDGIGLAAGGANVIMQLSMLPIGRGVVESRVDSGRLDRHPLKRARTTFTYLAVASGGTDAEKRELRHQISRVHAQVRSAPDAPVPYSAFDQELQLWVAACIYWGVRDVIIRLHGPMDDADAEDFYRRAASFGTTLQMPEDLWPENLRAFDEYWYRSIRQIRMDDATRDYLQRLAELRFLPRPLAALLGPANRFLTLGFLPEEFRRELGLPWTTRQQARFDRWLRFTASLNRVTPGVLRRFPYNLMLWDARRRMRVGKPII